MSFTLAIVGRPNVGKSTLFNRLVGRKLALVDDQPGVTRDLREGEARLGNLRFTILDTAGLEDATDDLGNPYDYAVMKLVDRGVEFRVCATTLSSREVAKADFLEEVLIVPSGVSEIARLQLKEAYAYLKP